jgi:4-hydroxybenzoyl-CoA reductase subunit beta
MGILKRFEYFEPSTIKEAVRILSVHGPEAEVLAGGTDLIVSLKKGLKNPRCIVYLKDITGLDDIEYSQKDGFKIGALATLHGIESSPLIQEKVPMLAEAAHQTASSHIRYMGTVGGNLCLDTRCTYYTQHYFWKRAFPACLKAGGEICHVVGGGKRCFSVYQGDLGPVFIALGGRAKLVNATGERIVPLSQFFTGEGKKPNVLKSDEFITEIAIPSPAEGDVGVYQKFRIRQAIDFPLVGVAVVMSFNNIGVCRRCRVVLGAVAAAPFEVASVAAVLQGEKIKDDLIEQAARVAFDTAHPLDNLNINASYRRRMVKVLVRQAIEKCLKLAGVPS